MLIGWMASREDWSFLLSLSLYLSLCVCLSLSLSYGQIGVLNQVVCVFYEEEERG